MKNFVIKNKTPEMGKEILEYFKSLGIYTGGHVGHVCEECGKTFIYYGVINGKFNNYTLEAVKKYGAEIIELPKEPKRGDSVYVSDEPINLDELDSLSKDLITRMYFGKIEGAKSPFFTVSAGEEGRAKKGEKVDLVSWKYMSPITKEKTYTMKDLVERSGIPEEVIRKIINN